MNEKDLRWRLACCLKTNAVWAEGQYARVQKDYREARVRYAVWHTNGYRRAYFRHYTREQFRKYFRMIK